MNGIRSAAKKGFFSWVNTQNADVICLQEIRAQAHQVSEHEHLKLPGYQSYFFDAKKKGYSGVAIYTRHKPRNITTGLGWELADQEGRYIQLDFLSLSVASLYMPSGTSGIARQSLKFEFLELYKAFLKKQMIQEREYIICGDFNIAHKPIDLRNWRSNQKHSGFLLEEREWFDYVFNSLGYVDAFRVLNQLPDQYTWWSNRGRAWEKNVGWRIDYQIVTPGLKDKIKSIQIYKETRFSDHAPLIIDYDLNVKI